MVKLVNWRWEQTWVIQGTGDKSMKHYAVQIGVLHKKMSIIHNSEEIIGDK